LEAIEKGARFISPELARECTLRYGVSQESIVKDDFLLLNTKGEPWTQKDKPNDAATEEGRLELIDLIISTVSEPSESLEPLLRKLQHLEQMDLMERGVLVRKKLLEISRVAQHFAKQEKRRDKAIANGSIRSSFEAPKSASN
jgi:hypothetical protein